MCYDCSLTLCIQYLGSELQPANTAPTAGWKRYRYGWLPVRYASCHWRLRTWNDTTWLAHRYGCAYGTRTPPAAEYELSGILWSLIQWYDREALSCVKCVSEKCLEKGLSFTKYSNEALCLLSNMRENLFYCQCLREALLSFNLYSYIHCHCWEKLKRIEKL